jgi:hypothetical protein
MTVDVTFDKVEDPTRLTSPRVQVNLPHGDVAGRERALLRVAEHCPVHETMCRLDGVEISLNGHLKQASAPGSSVSGKPLPSARPLSVGG